MTRPQSVHLLIAAHTARPLLETSGDIPTSYVLSPSDHDAVARYIEHLETTLEELSEVGLNAMERLRALLIQGQLPAPIREELENIHACLIVSDKPLTEKEKQVPPAAILSAFGIHLNMLTRRALNSERGLLPELEILEQDYRDAQQAAMHLWGEHADCPSTAGLGWEMSVGGLMVSLRKQIEING